MIIPQDILDCIIGQFGNEVASPEDFFPQNGLTADPYVPKEELTRRCNMLKSFCLVSRDCRRTAASFLFRTISIAGTSQQEFSKRSTQLFEGFTMSLNGSLEPRVITYIREIIIFRCSNDNYVRPDRGGPSLVDYLFQNTQLAKVMEILSGDDAVTISRLDIHLGYLPELVVNWLDLPLSFRMSLEALIRSPNLQVLSMHNIANLSHTIFDQTSLSVLHLTFGCPIPEDFYADYPQDIRVGVPTLKYLLSTFGDEGASQFFQTPPWRLAFNRLKGFNSTDPWGRFDRFIMQNSKQSLEILTVDVSERGMFATPAPTLSTLFNPFNFGAYSNLRKLVIMDPWRKIVEHSDGCDKTTDTYIWRIVEMLEWIDPCNCLHTLMFDLELFNAVFHDQTHSVPAADAEDSAWTKLDKILASLTRFPALKLFQILSTFIYPPSTCKGHSLQLEDMTRLTTVYMLGALPRVRESGVDLKWACGNIMLGDY